MAGGRVGATLVVALSTNAGEEGGHEGRPYAV
jgi:hypothetical protein